MTPPPLVVHLIYRLDFGGLETMLAECINRMPSHQYEHAVVCLNGYTNFAKKITRPGVAIYSLDKPPGLALATHLKLWKLLRQLRPAILHTYNLSAIEYTLTGALAGVPIRVHAEHGRDAADPEGKNRKHNMLRSLMTPLVDCYIPVSSDLQRWLRDVIHVPQSKNLLIKNGVDTEAFRPTAIAQQKENFIIGTVGRIQDVKNHIGLIDAFIRLREDMPAERSRLRLAIVGDGPLLPAVREKVAAAGITDMVWLPGARTDISDIIQTFSVFALPSIAEGTPVTLLEAMSAGLPVVATSVGGIPEVVVNDTTGKLVPANDAKALAAGIAHYVRQPELAAQHGAASRKRIERHYSMEAMLGAYTNLYDALCKTKKKFKEAVKPCAE